MKKLLLTTMLMLFGITAWAQNWVAPSEYDYPDETPIYVQVNVNGEVYQKAIVAAFIDGSCRAVNRGETLNNGLQTLRVRGDKATEQNKAITFKVEYQGVVYAMTKTVVFTGETEETVPFLLNVDAPTGVTLTNPLEIEAKLPYSHDLTQNIQFEYRDASGAVYTPLGESTIETALTYEWDFANSSQYFTVEKNILTATQVTESSGTYLGLSIPELNISTFTSVTITEPIIPVESITVNPSEFTITIADNLYEVPEIHQAITVLPADATNPAYRFEAADDAAAAVFEDGSFSEGGTYNIKVVSEADEAIFAVIKVTVVVPVSEIHLTSPSNLFYAVPNENVFDLISPYVSVSPANATNKDFHFVIPQEVGNAISAEGVANTPGAYNLTVVSDESDNVQTQAQVIVNAIEAPASVNINVGEYYQRVLSSQIRVLPVLDEMPFTYEIAPKSDTDAAGFDGQGQAIKSGTYTMVVTCLENPKATAEIVVNVKTPVTLTFPDQLEMSTLYDTPLDITFVEGDDFDPNLVEIEFSSHSELAFVLGQPVATPVENSNGLKWSLRAQTTGFYGIMVKYNGEYMKNTADIETTEVEVTAEVAFNHNGWDWIYIPGSVSLVSEDSGKYLSWLNEDANNRIIDLRSQTDLLYNDANLGLFGSITSLTYSDGMYKVKAQYSDAKSAIFDTQSSWESISARTLVKGYTWIGYPNEWDLSIDDYNQYIAEGYPDGDYFAVEGDMIIGKDGFAEFDGTAWVGSTGFYLQKGKGYLYYTESTEERDLDFGNMPEPAQVNRMQLLSLAAEAKSEMIWKYDAGAFADNMPIVAVVEGVDCPEEFTIGAFVGEECRGAGSVAKDGKMMISVVGKAGEIVTFRLHNKFTDEIFELNESVVYAGRLGSLNAPFVFTGNDLVSGIEQVDTTIGGEVEAIYDLNGRRVNETGKGIYILKVRQGDKVISKKVIR